MVRIGLFLYRKRPVYQWELITGTQKAFSEERTDGNERVSEMLSNALRKRHPYRAFKDKINELGISQLYYDYRSQAYLDKAEEWCRENSVAYRRK